MPFRPCGVTLEQMGGFGEGLHLVLLLVRDLLVSCVGRRVLALTRASSLDSGTGLIAMKGRGLC